LRKNLYIPADYYTDDTNSGIDGTWYDTGDGWVKTSLDENETGTRIVWKEGFTPRKSKQTAVIMKDTVSGNASYYHKYLAPPAAAVDGV